MRVAALLLCAVAVMGDSVAYTPTKKAIEHHIAQWGEYIKTGDGTSLLNTFTPDARVCFNGQCGGRDSILGFKNDQFKFLKIEPLEAVYMKDTFHMRWHDTIEMGRCTGTLGGVCGGYVNGEGKITEVHEWFSQEVFDKFYSKECIGEED